MVRTRFVPRTRSFAITVAGIRGLPGRPVDDDSHIALVVPGTSASADIEHRFVLRWSACRRGRERRVRLVGMRNMRVRPDRWDGAVAGYAGLAALCRPLTVEAAAAVALPGIALVVLAARRKPPPLVVLARRHVAPWAGLVVLLAGWEATAAAWGNDAAHPTLSLLLDPLLSTYPGRVAGWIVWLGVGRWLVTR